MWSSIMNAAGPRSGIKPTRDLPSRLVLWIACAIAAGFKLWLDSGLRIRAETTQNFDDALYVRTALWITRGMWLGDFNHLTMCKNPLYPIWLAINYWVGTPLLLAQSVLCIGAGLLLVVAMVRFRTPSTAAFATFLLLTYNPFVETRVMREGVYSSLLVITLAVTLLLADAVVTRSRTIVRWSIALGGALGSLWLVREEGMVLVPGFVLQAAGVMFLIWRSVGWTRDLARGWASLGLSVLVAVVAVSTVGMINYRYYGVFRINDQSAAPFRAAAGALFRVMHSQEVPHVLVPRETRNRVYQVSAAFAELEPYLDGSKGARALRAGWIEDTCRMFPPTCPDYGGAWVLRAFRQAVSDAGYYSSPLSADTFYWRIAQEIDSACTNGQLACLARRDSLLPPMRPSYPGLVVRTMLVGWGSTY